MVNKSHTRVDFLVVAPHEEERDAVLAHLVNPQRLPPDEQDVRVYYQAEVPTQLPGGAPGTYSVVVTSPLGQGRVEAATATADAIRRWEPRYVLLVGTASGDSQAVSLGDILVAEQFVDYEQQRLTDAGIQNDYQNFRADPRLLGAVQNLRGWEPAVKWKRPTGGQPVRHIGIVITGDKVHAKQGAIEPYKKHWPQLIGVEREAGGVAAAAWEAPSKPGVLMVRGVADWSGTKKDNARVKQWRPYACDVAAAYAVALLRCGPVPLAPAAAPAKDPGGAADPVHLGNRPARDSLRKRVGIFALGGFATSLLNRAWEWLVSISGGSVSAGGLIAVSTALVVAIATAIPAGYRIAKDTYFSQLNPTIGKQSASFLGSDQINKCAVDDLVFRPINLCSKNIFLDTSDDVYALRNTVSLPSPPASDNDMAVKEATVDASVPPDSQDLASRGSVAVSKAADLSSTIGTVRDLAEPTPPLNNTEGEPEVNSTEYFGWIQRSISVSPNEKISRERHQEIVKLLQGGRFSRPDMAQIPPGSFDYYKSKPIITNPYEMEKTETTSNQFLAICAQFPSCMESYGLRRRAYDGVIPGRSPAVFVSWLDAIQYSNWLSIAFHLAPCYKLTLIKEAGTSKSRLVVRWPMGISCSGFRLPTSAEWQLAAIGKPGDLSVFADPKAFLTYAWAMYEPFDYQHISIFPAEVGRKKQNGYNLYDLAGNVEEWVWDWYGNDRVDGPIKNPTGPINGEDKVTHGGSFKDSHDRCGPQSRSQHLPDDYGVDIGFRVVRTLKSAR